MPPRPSPLPEDLFGDIHVTREFRSKYVSRVTVTGFRVTSMFEQFVSHNERVWVPDNVRTFVEVTIPRIGTFAAQIQKRCAWSDDQMLHWFDHSYGPWTDFVSGPLYEQYLSYAPKTSRAAIKRSIDKTIDAAWPGAFDGYLASQVGVTKFATREIETPKGYVYLYDDAGVAFYLTDDDGVFDVSTVEYEQFAELADALEDVDQ